MTNRTGKNDSFAVRLGQTLGRGVGRMLRAEQSAWARLSAVLPSVIVTAVKWLARVVVVGGGTVLAAWGLLYVLAVLAMIAIVLGGVTGPNMERGLRRTVLPTTPDPYGTVTNVFGQRKDVFESDDHYR